MTTVEQLRRFLDDDRPGDRRLPTRTGVYRFVERTLQRVDYFHLGRRDKGVVRRYLGRVTGLSRAQLTRLLHQHRATGRLVDRRHATARSFPRRYTNADVELLAEIDALHGSWCGPTTRQLCARAWRLFGDRRFERLAGISNGHLYNLRHSTTYRRHRANMPEATHPVSMLPPPHWRPRTDGLPGHLRVVPLHLSAPEDAGELYLLALVDEITQFQFVASVEHLNAICLSPVLDALRQAFPFVVRGFHPPAGADHAVRRVAGMLHKLHLAYDRPGPNRRHARVATRPRDKEAGPARHLHGCSPGRRTRQVNAFALEVLSPYLNYHRPRRFPAKPAGTTETLGTHGRDADIMTPYERLKSLPGAAACLKPGTTFAELDAVATAVSDNEAARALSDATVRLLRSVAPGGERASASAP